MNVVMCERRVTRILHQGCMVVEGIVGIIGLCSCQSLNILAYPSNSGLPRYLTRAYDELRTMLPRCLTRAYDELLAMLPRCLTRAYDERGASETILVTIRAADTRRRVTAA